MSAPLPSADARWPGRARCEAVSRNAAATVRLLLTPADAATAIKRDRGVGRRVLVPEPNQIVTALEQ